MSFLKAVLTYIIFYDRIEKQVAQVCAFTTFCLHFCCGFKSKKKTVGILTLGHWTDFSKHVPLQMIKDWKTYVGAHILLIILF